MAAGRTERVLGDTRYSPAGYSHAAARHAAAILGPSAEHSDIEARSSQGCAIPPEFQTPAPYHLPNVAAGWSIPDQCKL
jgi:hypothetical protein